MKKSWMRHDGMSAKGYRTRDVAWGLLLKSWLHYPGLVKTDLARGSTFPVLLLHDHSINVICYIRSLYPWSSHTRPPPHSKVKILVSQSAVFREGLPRKYFETVLKKAQDIWPTRWTFTKTMTMWQECSFLHLLSCFHHHWHVYFFPGYVGGSGYPRLTSLTILAVCSVYCVSVEQVSLLIIAVWFLQVRTFQKWNVWGVWGIPGMDYDKANILSNHAHWIDCLSTHLSCTDKRKTSLTAPLRLLHSRRAMKRCQLEEMAMWQLWKGRTWEWKCTGDNNNTMVTD